MSAKIPAIELSGVNKTFVFRDKISNTFRDWILSGFKQGSTRKVEALKDINIQVHAGEFVGIIGGNGSGKSTLLHIISGAYKPDKGGVVHVEKKTLRLSLGMGFNNELTARENIQINASLLGLTFKEIREVIDEIIEFGGLKNFENTKIKYYSKGMRMRLAFSVALYTKAEILLLDEIFGGVGDRVFRKKANDAFKSGMLDGKTVVLASHSMKVLERFAKRVILLESGKIIAEGPADEVIEKYKDLTSE
jgi:ABC-2 type transport system ATP-binding protein